LIRAGLVLMTIRRRIPTRRVLLALACAAAAAALFGSGADPAAAHGAATGTIRGLVTLPAGAGGRRPSVSRPGTVSAADRQQDAVDRQTSVLYLDNMPRGMAGETVERHARLDQRGERFVPHIVAIGVGGTVDFPNSDPTFHNVFSLSDTRSFDLGRYATGKSKTVKFDKPGVVRVFCDIHAHMSAFIFVFAHPYFAVTDGQGRFRIDGVPAGTHQLVLWNETIDPETRQVTVPDGGEVEVNFTVASVPAPR
jgi:plastocyanin